MLELKQSLNLRLQQTLVMTPQLQQAIRLLQLNRMELVDAIQAEMEQNPALEEELRPEPSALEEEAAILKEDPAMLQPVREVEKPKEVSGDSQAANEIDWTQWLESYNSYSPPGAAPKAEGNEDLPTLEQTLKASETLQEHLLWQLHMAKLVDADISIAEEIIGSLDENGFLSGEHITEEIAIRLKVSVEHVERVLGLVQQLEPLGIASRDLKECLLIQLRVSGNKNKLAEKLVQEYLPELEKRNYQGIAKKEEVEIEAVGEALKIIQRLDPRPARNFGGEDSIYITPDIYVHKIGDEYVIVQNEDGLPLLRVSKYYRAALANGMSSEAKSYVNEKLRSATWLIRSIHQRQKTIYRVMESILKFQRDFFDKGIHELKPLILRNVAEDIGMHESTISRVTSNKYVHTPQGIFELKYFFNSSINTMEGEDSVASASVKHRIKQIIEVEDPKHPLSDQAIVEILSKEDIDIARRTVAKYREALGILSSSKRKQIL